MNSLMLFLTQDMSEIGFLKQILCECRPVRVWVFFSKAGKFHENNNLFAINISCWLCSSLIVETLPNSSLIPCCQKMIILPLSKLLDLVVCSNANKNDG